MLDKASYFEQLYSLNNELESDGEPNEVREFLKKCNKPIVSASPKEPTLLPPQKVQKPFKKVPTIQRSFSEPKSTASTTSACKGLPGPIQKRFSIHSESPITAPASSSFEKQIASPLGSADCANIRLNADRRALSNPTTNTLVLKNSTGIASMLSKKRKRDVAIKLVSEASRFLKDLEIYFLPNDDKSPVRKLRITKAREFGATWTKVLTTTMTHLVVDDNLTKQDVMKFLKCDLPLDVIMVKSNYLVECFERRSLCNPQQSRFQVKDLEAEASLPPSTSQHPNTSLQTEVAPRRPGRWDYVPPEQTPPRNIEATQASQYQYPLGASARDQPKRKGLSSDISHLRDEEDLMPAKTGDLGELEKFIDQAKDELELNLESDESMSDEQDDSGEDEGNSPLKTPATRRGKVPAGKAKLANFQCMTSGISNSDAPNPNAHTIDILDRMQQYYQRNGDVWRTKSYRAACGSLKKQNRFIATYDEAVQLPGIASRIAAKIEEIALSGRLRRLDNAEAEPNDGALKAFMGIYGVNIRQASVWIQQGLRTLEDLKKVKLNPSQQVGLDHYDDLQQRIPRDEVTALGKYIKDAAAIVDSQVEIIIGGSYRRGAKTSGDIDLIVTKPSTSHSSELMRFLHDLVQYLTKKGFLVAALAVPHNEEGSKWHGCCVLPSLPKEQRIWRRIDFLLVPAAELGAALIYFTGDDIFNRSMRLLASTKKMRLNQRGLYKDVMRERGTRKKQTEGTLVEARDEKRIFAALGVPWREPHERIRS